MSLSFARLFCIGALFFTSVSSCTATHPSNYQPRLDCCESNTPTDQEIEYPLPSCTTEQPIVKNGVLLPVLHFHQQMPYILTSESSKLCWAASIAMISTYLGTPRMPCDVASYISPEKISCCALTKYSFSKQRDHCNQTALTSQSAFILHRMGIYARYETSPLSEGTIQHELSNGRPIMLHQALGVPPFQRNHIPGHIIVIVGFTKKNTYIVHDPMHAFPDELTYTELLHGTTKDTWTWVLSWYHFSYRADGCNPRVQSCVCSE